MSTSNDPASRGPAADDKAKDAVRQRLREELAGVPVAELERAIDASWDRYANGRIRDFVPLLVERDIRKQVASGALGPADP